MSARGGGSTPRAARRRVGAAPSWTLGASLLALLAAPLGAPLGAQQQPLRPPRLRPELRLDAIAGDAPALHTGAGLAAPLGVYVRAAGVLGIGAARRDGRIVGSARAEATVRYLLDPFRERRAGLYGGGGLALRQDAGDRARAWLVAVVGIEGSVRPGGWLPALELGLGGGARLGVVLRGARRAGR